MTCSRAFSRISILNKINETSVVTENSELLSYTMDEWLWNTNAEADKIYTVNVSCSSDQSSSTLQPRGRTANCLICPLGGVGVMGCYFSPWSVAQRWTQTLLYPVTHTRRSLFLPLSPFRSRTEPNHIENNSFHILLPHSFLSLFEFKHIYTISKHGQSAEFFLIWNFSI